MSKQFCIGCRKEVDYNLVTVLRDIEVKDKIYKFEVVVAQCGECGETVLLPGMIDLNSKKIDEQYRKIEELVTVKEIQDLMSIYDMEKTSLASVLGLEDATIVNYLNGQYPSKQNSDVIRKALVNPSFMTKSLKENED